MPILRGLLTHNFVCRYVTAFLHRKLINASVTFSLQLFIERPNCHQLTYFDTELNIDSSNFPVKSDEIFFSLFLILNINNSFLEKINNTKPFLIQKVLQNYNIAW